MNERYHLRRCAQSSQPARRLARGVSTGPHKTPPKTAVWFIKPRNTVIGDGEAIPYPQGETVQSGATVALIVGKTARKVAAEEAANYIAGYALANDVSLPEESFYRPAIKAKCRDGFCPIGTLSAVRNVDDLTIITEINGREADSWHTGDLQRNARAAAELLERIRHPQSRRRDPYRHAPLASRCAPATGYVFSPTVSRRSKTRLSQKESWHETGTH